MSPPAGANSSRRNARLAAIVDEWAQSHGYVAFDSSGGFRLGASEVVSPDASLVAAENWAKLGDEERELFYPERPPLPSNSARRRTSRKECEPSSNGCAKPGPHTSSLSTPIGALFGRKARHPAGSTLISKNS